AGTFTYDPTAATSFETMTNGSSIADTFTYTVTDNHGVSALATGSVVVTITDSGPISSAAGSTTEDLVTATVTATTSVDGGDTLDSVNKTTGYVLSSATSTLGASVSYNVGAGTFTYDPTAATSFETMTNGSSIADTFTYTVTDNHGVSALATGSVVVTITDSGPISSAAGSTTEDLVTATVTATTSVDGGDTLDSVNKTTGYVLSSATSTLGASVSYNVGAGTFTYDPTAATSFETMTNGSSIADTFTYTVTDNHGVSALATGSVVVTITDSGPVSRAAGSTNEDATTTVTATTSVDGGDTLDSVNKTTGYVLSSATSTLGASVSYNVGAGTFTYDPTAATSFETMTNGSSIADPFTYTV